jgi:hypothetical protein
MRASERRISMNKTLTLKKNTVKRLSLRVVTNLKAGAKDKRIAQLPPSIATCNCPQEK